MARKKMVVKSNTAMVSMVDWEKKLEAFAVEESARVKGGSGNYIGVRGKEFAYQGADLGSEIDVVILDFAFSNEKYDTVYDPESPEPPGCFAISKALDDMVPTENSPNKRSEDCAACEFNQWGSAERGKGKGCSNRRRVAMISAADLDKPVEDIEVVLLRVAPMSLKNFDKYYKGVAKIHRRPTYGVITRLAFDEESDYEVVTFEATDKIANAEHMSVIMQKREECQEALLQEPDFSGYSGEAKAKPKKKVTATAVTGKRKSKFSR